jgi:hypothetical protein
MVEYYSRFLNFANPSRQMHKANQNQSRLGRQDHRPASVRLRAKLMAMEAEQERLAAEQAAQVAAASARAQAMAEAMAEVETAPEAVIVADSPTPDVPKSSDWQQSVDRIYARKSNERRPQREGDPAKYRQTAAEITARRRESETLIDDKTADWLTVTDAVIDDGVAAGGLITALYPSLPLPLQSPGYAHWRQMVGENFWEHQMVVGDRSTQQVDQVLGQTLWQILQQFGIEAAYVFLLLAAKATRSRNPWEELVELSTADLLNLNIWDKEAEQGTGRRLRGVGNWVELVCSLSLLITKVEPESQRFKALRVPFWVMEEMEFAGAVTGALGVVQPEECSKLTVRVGLGLWSEQFVDVPDEEKRSGLGRFGFQASSILHLNPMRKPLAAKLAMLLLLLNQSQGDQFYCVGSLLELIESKSTIIEMQRRKERRNYFCSRWSTALHTMQKLGWQIEFDPETYPESLQPTWHQTEVTNTVTDDAWLRAWLKAKVRILPPSPPTPPIDRPELPLQERFTGRTLACALELQGMSRSKLAEHLQLDRSMVTYWIKGSRSIQPKHRELICELLGNELQQVLDTH